MNKKGHVTKIFFEYFELAAKKWQVISKKKSFPFKYNICSAIAEKHYSSPLNNDIASLQWYVWL